MIVSTHRSTSLRLWNDVNGGMWAIFGSTRIWRRRTREWESVHRDRHLFPGRLRTTLDEFQVPERERGQGLAFVESTGADIVE